MRFELGRTFGLCLLAAVMMSVVHVSGHADAANCSCDPVGQVCDCAGRVLGMGWSDGYHACKSSGQRCLADLPPKSYVAYQRHQASSRLKSCNQRNACSTVYDHFDAGCGSCCDGGCELSRDCCECDHGPACDGGCESILETSPSDMHAAPLGDAAGLRPESVTNAESQVAGGGVAGKPAHAEQVFRRFVATMTPQVIVPVHPYEKQAAATRSQGTSQGVATQVQRRPNGEAGAASRIYPTLVAPPRAGQPVSGQRGNQPALRLFDRAGVSNAQRGGVNTRLEVQESSRNYSTLREVEARTARALRSDAPTLPRWVIEATENVRPMPQAVARQARGVYPQQVSPSPVLELATRPSYSVDNVIRQPDIQR